MDLIVCEFVFIILINMRRIINTFYIFHSVFFDISFDPLLGHDFLHVCKIISVRR